MIYEIMKTFLCLHTDVALMAFQSFIYSTVHLLRLLRINFKVSSLDKGRNYRIFYLIPNLPEN